MNTHEHPQPGSPQPPSVIFGRPTLSRSGFAPETLARRCDALLRQADALAARGGGLLAIGHPPGLLTAALLLTASVYGRLRFGGSDGGNEGRGAGRVRLYRPALEGALLAVDLPERLVVQDLSADPSLLDLLAGQPFGGRLVIATAPWHWWEQHRVTLPMAFARLDGPDVGDAALATVAAEAAAEETAALVALSPAAVAAYLHVALWDAWGVPLPFELLARAAAPQALGPADIDAAAEDAAGNAVAEADDAGLLHWVELDHPAGLSVATRAPLLARAGAAHLLQGNDPRPVLADLAAAADASEPEQRLAVLRLLQGLLAAGAEWPEVANAWSTTEGHGSWTRGFHAMARPALLRLAERSSPREALAWSRVLEALAEPALADKVLARGLRADPANVALLQSRARHLGRWACRDRRQAVAATQAFEAAVAAAPNNPFIWQARGVWALDMGEVDTALRHLKQALQCAESDAEHVYTLIALADAALSQGRPDAAEKWLDDAERIAPDNPYVPHVRGEAARWRGDFEAAAAAYVRALQLDARNVPAAQSQGDMALKRGHWRRAEAYLTDALAWQADNLPARHALGELRAEQAVAAQAARDAAAAATLFDAAETAYRAVLDIEPRNLQALLALAVLMAKRGRPEDAERSLAQARAQDAGNAHALHALASIRAAQGRLDEAERLCNDILYDARYRERENLPALLLLAEIDSARGVDASARIRRIEQAMGAQPLAAEDRAKALNAFALVQRRSGDITAAVATLRANQARDRANTYTLLALAETLDAVGDTADAAALRTQAQGLREAPRD